MKKIGSKLENYKVEDGKRVTCTIDKTEKRFFVDAINTTDGIIIEVENAQTIYANKCYYDIFKACMINNVDYIVIAVPINYLWIKNKVKKPDNAEIVSDEVYEDASKDIEAIFKSRFGKRLPLKGILLIGY